MNRIPHGRDLTLLTVRLLLATVLFADAVLMAGGGWQLVGAISAALAGLAVAGPGRLGVAHLVERHRARRSVLPEVVAEPPAYPPLPGSDDPFAEPAPAAGLPYVPIVRFAPTPVRPSPLPVRARVPAPQE